MFFLVADSFRNPSEWCRLAYWELAQRVGPLYPVEAPAVNVFGDVPYCDGLSLETLSQQNCNAPESVRHGRCKIGLGVYMSLILKIFPPKKGLWKLERAHVYRQPNFHSEEKTHL